MQYCVNMKTPFLYAVCPRADLLCSDSSFLLLWRLGPCRVLSGPRDALFTAFITSAAFGGIAAPLTVLHLTFFRLPKNGAATAWVWAEYFRWRKPRMPWKWKSLKFQSDGKIQRILARRVEMPHRGYFPCNVFWCRWKRVMCNFVSYWEADRMRICVYTIFVCLLWKFGSYPHGDMMLERNAYHWVPMVHSLYRYAMSIVCNMRDKSDRHS